MYRWFAVGFAVAASTLVLLIHSSSSFCWAESPEPEFVYLAGALVGSFPTDRDAVFQDRARSPTKIRMGVGAGIKAGVFPAFTNHILGIEIESMGHSGRVQFPLSSNGSGRSGSSSVTVFTTMANLIVQYPGRRVMPYAGVGLGWATGVLTDTDIPGRGDRGLEGSSVPSYQILAGVRAMVTDHFFAYCEYKHQESHFHWTSLALDVNANYALVGFGYRF